MKNFRTKLLKIVFIFIILASFNSSCNEKNLVVPYVYVYFQIDINQPDMQDLLPITGKVFVNGGHRGIVIYHNAYNEFTAYDRACTYHPQETCRIQINSENVTTLKCDCCESEYSLYNNGFPTKSPAIIALQKYQTSYNPNTQILTVSN